MAEGDLDIDVALYRKIIYTWDHPTPPLSLLSPPCHFHFFYSSTPHHNNERQELFRDEPNQPAFAVKQNHERQALCCNEQKQPIFAVKQKLLRDKVILSRRTRGTCVSTCLRESVDSSYTMLSRDKRAKLSILIEAMRFVNFVQNFVVSALCQIRTRQEGLFRKVLRLWRRPQHSEMPAVLSLRTRDSVLQRNTDSPRRCN